MITIYTDKKSLSFYKVRVFARSNINPLLRITKQQGGIASLREAEKVEEQLKKESQRELSSLEARGILFEDLLCSWNEHFIKMRLLTGMRATYTQEDYVATVRKWFKHLLRQPATDLNSYKVTEIFEEMKASGITFVHLKKMKQILKSIFDFGIQSGMINIPRSPTIDVILKRDVEKKPEILNTREIQTLIDRAYGTDHLWKRVWAVALLTGMRSGELYALEWKDIDWDNKVISVNKSFNCRLKEFKSTKAGYWRHVPISADLELVLKDQFQYTSRINASFREMAIGLVELRQRYSDHSVISADFQTSSFILCEPALQPRCWGKAWNLPR